MTLGTHKIDDQLQDGVLQNYGSASVLYLRVDIHQVTISSVVACLTKKAEVDMLLIVPSMVNADVQVLEESAVVKRWVANVVWRCLCNRNSLFVHPSARSPALPPKVSYDRIYVSCPN
jgi:hypothetical protein